MWRALFLAIGIYCCIVGVECLAIEKAVMKPKTGPDGVVAPSREIAPPEWAPWSLMAGGVVVVIYSATLRRPQG